jgi:hypothetical protein
VWTRTAKLLSASTGRGDSNSDGGPIGSSCWRDVAAQRWRLRMLYLPPPIIDIITFLLCIFDQPMFEPIRSLAPVQALDVAQGSAGLSNRPWLANAARPMARLLPAHRPRVLADASRHGLGEGGWRTRGTIMAMVTVVPRLQPDDTLCLVPHSSTTLSRRSNDLC